MHMILSITYIGPGTLLGKIDLKDAFPSIHQTEQIVEFAGPGIQKSSRYRSASGAELYSYLWESNG